MSGPPPERTGRDPATTRLLEVIEREAGLSQAGLEARVGRHWPPEQHQAVAARLAVLSWRDPEWQALVEPLLVHETYLFRDWAQLHHLAEIGVRELARCRDGTDRRLTVWTAGCASGEEAYSLAAVVRSALPQDDAGWSVAVVGSDLSRDMVERAGRATFSVAGLSAFRAMRPEFEALFPDAGGHCRTAHPELRRLVRFTADNLVQGPPPVRGADIVSCRNVLIYMADWARQAALARLTDAVAPGGVLLLGPTDRAPPDALFEPVWGRGAVFYRRRPPA